MSSHLTNKKRLCVAIISMLVSSLSILGSALAGSKPEIVGHNANFLGTSVNFNVQWQAKNPVTAVKIAVAGVNKSIEVDEYDNRRNQGGYWGEVSLDIKLPQDIVFNGTILPYVIELVDDLRQKSDQLRGHVIVVSKIEKDGKDSRRDMDRPLSDVSPLPANYGATVEKKSTFVDGNSNVTINIKVMQTGLPRQRMFLITGDGQNLPKQIQWHVLDKNGTKVCDQQILDHDQFNVFRTDLVELQQGQYKFIVQPLTSAGSSQETSFDFTIDDK